MGTNQSRWISDTCAALALAASMLGAQAAIAVPYAATYLGDGSSAVINNLGQVAVTTSSGAFLFSNGVKTDLGSLGGGGTQAVGINDFGQIVGTSRTSSGVVRSFLFGGGSMFPLAFADIQPVAINNARQVTGTYDLLGETHAFLLNPLGGVPLFRDLGTLSTCGFPYVPGAFVTPIALHSAHRRTSTTLGKSWVLQPSKSLRFTPLSFTAMA